MTRRATKQVALDKYGLEIVGSGRYQMREETQKTRASTLWYVMEEWGLCQLSAGFLSL